MRPDRNHAASPLAPHIERFLEHKRALGRRYLSEEVGLRLFERYLVEQQIRTIQGVTCDVINAFLASRPRPRPRSFNALLGVLRVLFRWLVLRGIVVRSPVQARSRRGQRRRTPVILGPDHVRQLLLAAGQLSDKFGGDFRGPTYRAIFSVLYTLGLRVGEVCRLCFDDIDWVRQLLVIRESKFGKSRLVPFGPRLGRMLKSYVEARRRRHGLPPGSAPVFSVVPGHPLRRQTIGRVFRQLRPCLGIDIPTGWSPPRVHDLRHAFAVRTLLRWYRAGIDPSRRLLHLSTFMGHAEPESTAVYLTITSELLGIAGARFERLAESLLPVEAP
mgnify:CR=1 FL=1